MWGELANSFQTGNPYVLLMTGFGGLAMIVFFQRTIMIKGVYNVKTSKFLGELRKMIEAEDHDRARNYCKTVSTTSVPGIALTALEAHAQDPDKVKGALEEAAIDFLPKIETGISILPAIATIILLLGVLGTVDGLWAAFHSIEILDTAKKQASLANGIAGALTPTAFGLVIAMTALAAHQIVRGFASTLVDKTSYAVTVLHNLLVPKETAVAYAAMPMGMATGAAANDSADDFEEEEEEEEDDTFDDAAIDDIKDEEEII